MGLFRQFMLGATCILLTTSVVHSAPPSPLTALIKTIRSGTQALKDGYLPLPSSIETLPTDSTRSKSANVFWEAVDSLLDLYKELNSTLADTDETVMVARRTIVNQITYNACNWMETVLRNSTNDHDATPQGHVITYFQDFSCMGMFSDEIELRKLKAKLSFYLNSLDLYPQLLAARQANYK